MRELVFTAVNATVNRKMLEAVPHRIICDGVAIIYRYVESGYFTNVITYSDAIAMGMTEEQLYVAASRNLKCFLPELKEESDGTYTITSPYSDAIGSSMAFMPEMLNQVLDKTGEKKVFISVGCEKTSIATRVSKIFKEMIEQGGRMICYTHNGFATI